MRRFEFSRRVTAAVAILVVFVASPRPAETGEVAGKSTAAGTIQSTPVERVIRDGDRITMLGGTYIERLQAFNYFEALVVAMDTDARYSFRNLGWSGDDVWGTARAVFGTQADGFDRLRRDLIATRPTLILVCYGGNESFFGRAGLSSFADGLSTLIDELEKTGARIVFLTPYRTEWVNSKLTDPAERNAEIDRYADRLSKIVRNRGHRVIDFRNPLRQAKRLESGRVANRDRLTDNGIHFSPYGHWRTAPELARRLGIGQEAEAWKLKGDLRSEKFTVNGGELSDFEITPTGFRIRVRDDSLPYAPPPEYAPKEAKLMPPLDRFQIKGLPAGKYGLRIDGRPTLMAPSTQWANEVVMRRGDYLDQFDRLRELIREKNELYFHRYRPQNETYLFLFRKHEQGNNAAEIPEFDPLVRKKEEMIERMKRPRKHQYEWVRIDLSDAQEKDINSNDSIRPVQE